MFIYNIYIYAIYSLSYDWLNIFYNICLRLILQYSTMFEGLVNSSKNSSSKLSTLSAPHFMSGGDQILFYLQCIVFISACSGLLMRYRQQQLLLVSTKMLYLSCVIVLQLIQDYLFCHTEVPMGVGVALPFPNKISQPQVTLHALLHLCQEEVSLLFTPFDSYYITNFDQLLFSINYFCVFHVSP